MGSTASSFGSGSRDDHENQLADIENIYHTQGKARRLIEWNVEILSGLLKNLVARRENKATGEPQATKALRSDKAPIEEHSASIRFLPPRQEYTSPVDTVEIVEVAECVLEQLTNYVSTIAHLYPENP